MKNLIIILVIAAMFSCTAKKMLVKSRTDQVSTQQNAITTTKSSQSDGSISIEGKLSDSVQKVTQTTKYDTEKPISSITGKSPIIEETTITETKIGNKVISKKIEVAGVSKSDSTANSVVNTSIKEESKSIETPKPAVKYYWYILITLIVLVVGFLVYRNFARVKGIFKLFIP